MDAKLIQQLKQAKNKEAFMMSTIPQENREMFNQFKQLDTQAQAQRIADYCNRNGISKEQLKNIFNGIN